MPYYQKHIFLCNNLKAEGKKCCAQGQPDAMREYLKHRLKELNQFGESKIRVSSAGCMGRCAVGPALVIYPQGLWYTYACENDIEEILQQSILADRVVERLLI